MSSKSKRLGTLADVFQAEKLEGTIRKINLAKIKPSVNQPRQDRKKGIEDLARSLADNGLLQPIVVTKDSQEDTYKIIAGERRYHAASSLSWTEIECKILHKNEKETYKLAIIENLQRENLSPYEEIDAVIQLKSNFNYTDMDIGGLLGKSRSYTSELLSIANLTKDELNDCKKANIDNKNLLVQAAQSAKKGTFKSFIESITNGQVKTVKEAKLFNKETTPSNVEDLFPRKAPPYSITKTDNNITISAPDNQTAIDIYKIIKATLAKKYKS